MSKRFDPTKPSDEQCEYCVRQMVATHVGTRTLSTTAMETIARKDLWADAGTERRKQMLEAQ